ncbi:MAG: DEAD/DEAH box helicase, partial [Candidatus Korarchaeota archaeon]|nr:DEAD/DEAH box helicase [Candidatus Korarchaeota archaeon]
MIPAVFRGLCPGGDLETHHRSPCVEDEISKVGSEFKDYVKFFKLCLSSPPWEIQRMWARRALAGRSFAAIAPTGVGKTAFGLVTSYYFAVRGRGRSYLLFPTSLLVDQAVEILTKYKRSAGEPLKILAYRSGMRSKQRREFLEKLESGD